MRSGSLTVAFVNSTRKWGGVKTWTLDFGAALLARGHRVHALLRPGTPFVEACRGARFDVHPLVFGFKYNPVAIARAARVFARVRPDVVVVNISKDLEVGAVAARLLRIPILHRVGLVEDYRGTRGERLRHRFLVDRVLLPAVWMKGALLGAQPWLRAEEISVVPNSKPTAGVPVARGSGGLPVTFGAASQLSPSKGHGFLLDAFEELLRQGVPARLLVAGAGPLEGELRARVAGSGLAAAVEFCGFQRDMPAFLGGLDGFVLPSLKEGFPNVLLEAMEVGLPAVASDIPGAREMLGGTGLLVPAGDAPGLAGALGRLAGDAALRRTLGEAARRRVETHYDLARNVAQLEGLLREMARR
jgi:glycosyltransferase involved in cell wall biosynthesis